MMKTPEQHAQDRQVIKASIQTMREMTGMEFIVLGFVPDDSPAPKGKTGFMMSVVTSLPPENTILLLEQALKSAKRHVETFEAQKL